MSHDGFFADARGAPHPRGAAFTDRPAAPTTVHSMLSANGGVTDDGDECMGSGDDDAGSGPPSRSGSGLNLASASAVDIVKEGKKVIRAFLREHRCYDLVKNSSKVVVFDVKIPINLAFFALVEHGRTVPFFSWFYCRAEGELTRDGCVMMADIKSVPIWDAEQNKFVGMFTATDFVNILRHFYIRGSPMNELAEHSIASWRGAFAGVVYRPTCRSTR